MYLGIKSMMKPKNGNTFYQKILKIGLMKYWATADPYGAPIPACDGTIDDRSVYQLSGLVVGNRATITEVSDEDTDLLRYLGELKLYPQTEIEVISISPIDGVMTIRPCLETGNSGNLVIGQKVASCISVTILQQDEPGKES